MIADGGGVRGSGNVPHWLASSSPHYPGEVAS